MPTRRTTADEMPRDIEPRAQSHFGIRRDGRTVRVELQLESEYAAIELYDRLVRSAQAGELRLDVKLAGR